MIVCADCDVEVCFHFLSRSSTHACRHCFFSTQYAVVAGVVVVIVRFKYGSVSTIPRNSRKNEIKKKLFNSSPKFARYS